MYKAYRNMLVLSRLLNFASMCVAPFFMFLVLFNFAAIFVGFFFFNLFQLLIKIINLAIILSL